MEFLSQLNLETLGVSGILVGFLLFQNWKLERKLERDEDYHRQKDEKRMEALKETAEALRSVQQALVLLRESIK